MKEIKEEHSGTQEGQLEGSRKDTFAPSQAHLSLAVGKSLSFPLVDPSYKPSSYHAACQQHYFLHYMAALPRQLSPHRLKHKKRKEGRRGS